MSIFTRKRARDRSKSLHPSSRRPILPIDVLESVVLDESDELSDALRRNYPELGESDEFIIGYREGFRAGSVAFR